VLLDELSKKRCHKGVFSEILVEERAIYVIYHISDSRTKDLNNTIDDYEKVIINFRHENGNLFLKSS